MGENVRVVGNKGILELLRLWLDRGNRDSARLINLMSEEKEK